MLAIPYLLGLEKQARPSKNTEIIVGLVLLPKAVVAISDLVRSDAVMHDWRPATSDVP